MECRLQYKIVVGTKLCPFYIIESKDKCLAYTYIRPQKKFYGESRVISYMIRRVGPSLASTLVT